MNKDHTNPPGDDLPPEVSPGGSEIIRHEMGDGPDDITYLSEQDMDAIERHVEEHFGKVESVLHELISDGVHLDLLPVHFEEDGEAFTFLGTMGMSALPMTLPDLEEGDDPDDLPPARAELFMLIPGRWEVSEEEADWHVMALKMCGRIPSLFDSFLAMGHTIPNEDPPEPYTPDCPFVGALVLSGDILKEGFAELNTGDGTVAFYALVPLYAEEMDYKLEHGIMALIDKFEEHEIDPAHLADPQRPNVCA